MMLRKQISGTYCIRRNCKLHVKWWGEDRTSTAVMFALYMSQFKEPLPSCWKLSTETR